MKTEPKKAVRLMPESGVGCQASTADNARTGWSRTEEAKIVLAAPKGSARGALGNGVGGV